MQAIRISVLYAYYCTSLAAIVDKLYELKNAYTNGEISYKRAWNKMNQLLKLGWQRAKLCDNLHKALNGGCGEKAVEHRRELEFIINWMC